MKQLKSPCLRHDFRPPDSSAGPSPNLAPRLGLRQYAREMKYKLARYHELGVKFISLYPDNLPNLDGVFRKRFREATGVELPGKGRRQKAERAKRKTRLYLNQRCQRHD